MLISKSLLMQPLTALSLWMWVQRRNWWQSSGMENGQKTNIMSPNVDVSCVAVEKRGHETLRSSVPLEMEVTAVLEKLVSRVKLALHHHLSVSVYKVYVLFYKYTAYISTECSKNQAEEDQFQNGHIAFRILS